MKIAIATPTLYESVSPYNHLFSDILEGFLSAGYSVVRYAACRSESDTDFTYGLDAVEHHRCVRKESGRGNIISRYLRDSFTAFSEARGVRKSDADVLFEDVSYCSHFFVRAAARRGMKIVAMVQDVWPDNAVQTGLIRKGGLLYRFFESVQRYVYRKADRIVCISDDIRAFLIEKGIPAEKIEVIYNWGYGDAPVSIPWEENRFVQKYGLSKDRFYAVYAGNIGRMQNVGLVAEAAALLQADEKIRFLIVGDGVKRDEISAAVKDMPNVTMLPMQPQSLAEHVYSAAGVNLIPLQPGGAKTAMPSKTAVILSCGRPTVFCFGADASFTGRLGQYPGCESVDPGDAQALADAIRAMKNAPKTDGPAALFVELFTRSKNIARYADAVRFDRQEGTR